MDTIGACSLATDRPQYLDAGSRRCLGVGYASSRW